MSRGAALGRVCVVSPMTRSELGWESRRVLELIQGLPDAVVGLEAVGTVTVEDCESTLVPRRRAGRYRAS